MFSPGPSVICLWYFLRVTGEGAEVKVQKEGQGSVPGRETSKEEEDAHLDILSKGKWIVKSYSKWTTNSETISHTNYRLVAVEELDLEGKQQWTPPSVCIKLAERHGNKNALTHLGDTAGNEDTKAPTQHCKHWASKRLALQNHLARASWCASMVNCGSLFH